MICLCQSGKSVTSFNTRRLAKFGVETSEFDDGLIVYGRPVSSLRSGVSVHTYDDHRVAMSFSVLATVVPGTILEEKRCVEKTWPNWWDDLSNRVGYVTLCIKNVLLRYFCCRLASLWMASILPLRQRAPPQIPLSLRSIPQPPYFWSVCVALARLS